MQGSPRNVSVYRMRPVNYSKNLRDDFFSINTTHKWTYLDAQLAGVGCLGNYKDTLALLKGEPSAPSYNISINISITPSVGEMLLHGGEAGPRRQFDHGQTSSLALPADYFLRFDRRRHLSTNFPTFVPLFYWTQSQGNSCMAHPHTQASPS